MGREAKTNCLIPQTPNTLCGVFSTIGYLLIYSGLLTSKPCSTAMGHKTMLGGTNQSQRRFSWQRSRLETASIKCLHSFCYLVTKVWRTRMRTIFVILSQLRSVNHSLHGPVETRRLNKDVFRFISVFLNFLRVINRTVAPMDVLLNSSYQRSCTVGWQSTLVLVGRSLHAGVSFFPCGRDRCTFIIISPSASFWLLGPKFALCKWSEDNSAKYILYRWCNVNGKTASKRKVMKDHFTRFFWLRYFADKGTYCKL